MQPLPLPFTIQSFSFDGKFIHIPIPEVASVKQYLRSSTAFPYWAQIWPSAIALAHFLVDNKTLIADKTVLELAAGLGLPGLVAARYAATVTISDYLADAVTFIEHAITLNQSSNIIAQQLNWLSLPQKLLSDVLLLSDINYEPDSFDGIFQMFKRFLLNGTTIVLATPQRLMAKTFMERILPYAISQHEIFIGEKANGQYISIFIFKT